MTIWSSKLFGIDALQHHGICNGIGCIARDSIMDRIGRKVRLP